MTFRQALHAVWRRKLVVVIVVAVAVAAAAVFLARQTPTYSSAASFRMSAFATAASTSGQIGTSAVDFDTSSITSSAVLAAAAKKLGEPASAVGSWAVTATSGPSTGSEAPSTLTITADGSSAGQSQRRVNAVVSAYDDYLVAQTATARQAAVAQAAKWTAEAQADQAVVTKEPGNSIAQSSLTNAISSLTNANNTIASIDNAGRPVLVTVPAAPGEFQGTSPLIAILVALAAGLVAGIGVALIWDAFDDRLRPEDDLEALVGVPSLGELPLDKAARRGRDRLPAAGRARSTLNEGLRSLRTSLQVLLPPESGVVVVTSVEPGDGKTFISSNIALAWARMGKTVLLIGGDLRKAELEERFGVTAGPGLTELLQEAARTGAAPTPNDVAQRLRETTFPGLHILPAGEEPWDPADLLALDAMGEVVAAMRLLFDVIVIDSPPSLALVDARLLAVHADGVVVVASMRRTRRNPLRETVASLGGSGSNVLGVVVNRSRRSIPRTYAEYYGARRVPGPMSPTTLAPAEPTPATDAGLDERSPDPTDSDAAEGTTIDAAAVVPAATDDGGSDRAVIEEPDGKDEATEEVAADDAPADDGAADDAPVDEAPAVEAPAADEMTSGDPAEQGAETGDVESGSDQPGDHGPSEDAPDGDEGAPAQDDGPAEPTPTPARTGPRKRRSPRNRTATPALEPDPEHERAPVWRRILDPRAAEDEKA